MQPRHDTPIESPSEDLLGRMPLVRYVADVLTSIRSDESYVVGLSGPWGSGKTSFVNMLENELRARNDPPAILRFNPWLYSSEEQLLGQFFAELKVALCIKEGSDLGKLLVDYSGMISEAFVDLFTMANSQVAAVNAMLPFVGPLSKAILKCIVKSAGKRVNHSEVTVAQTRDKIAAELRKLGSNIVIIMDDIDRLSSSEIRLLFKLVNLTASFPRMTYLMSYDVRVVSKALGDVQGIDGFSYLEKIVQLPIELPNISAGRLQSLLEERLIPYLESLESYEMGDLERTRLSQVFSSIVLELVTTPRKVKRYLNSFDVTVEKVGEDVCPVDVMGMAAISLFCPHVYDWIWANKMELCGKTIHYDNQDRAWAQALYSSLDIALEQDFNNVDAAKSALTTLFPTIREWKSRGYCGGKNELRETGRVANIDNLERLYYGLASDEFFPRVELHRLVMEAPLFELEEGILELDRRDDYARLIEMITSNSFGISHERKNVLATALIDTLGKINQFQKPHFFEPFEPERASRLLEELLDDLGTSEVDDIVSRASSRFMIDDYIGITWLLKSEWLARQGEGSRKPCLSNEAYSRLTSEYIEAIVDHYPYVLGLPDHQAKFFWRGIDVDGDGEGLRKIRVRYGNDPGTRVLCAAAGLSSWISADGKGYGPRNSDSNGWEPVLTEPNLDEIRRFARPLTLLFISEDMRMRVAACYLSRERCLEAPTGDWRISQDEAQRLVRQWLS